MKKTLLSCLILLLSPLFLKAQIANNTSLVGTVTDPSGGLVSGGKVTAVEESTKVQSVAITNAYGYYAITFIQPGTYDITVEQSGFKTMTQDRHRRPYRPGSPHRLRAAARLNRKASSPSRAFMAPMATDDANLGETFNTRAVEDLPISGHNALEVAAVASNVYIDSGTNYQGNPPGEDFLGAGQR